MDRVVGRRLFNDGLERDVSEDAGGRQYVFDVWPTRTATRRPAGI
jgi:hypothetical protein